MHVQIRCNLLKVAHWNLRKAHTGVKRHKSRFHFQLHGRALLLVVLLLLFLETYAAHVGDPVVMIAVHICPEYVIRGQATRSILEIEAAEYQLSVVVFLLCQVNAEDGLHAFFGFVNLLDE